ncbi:MAG: hypothetical protein IPP91_05430 [Betaproteobacteria bacterium]|nr:hypothetical protein [Betaproteobacteria bacterium]
MIAVLSVSLVKLHLYAAKARLPTGGWVAKVPWQSPVTGYLTPASLVSFNRTPAPLQNVPDACRMNGFDWSPDSAALWAMAAWRKALAESCSS